MDENFHTDNHEESTPMSKDQGATNVRSLTELLGKTIQDTANGKCTVENANAIAKLAAQMNNLLRTGLDAMRLQVEMGGKVLADPVALVLGSPKKMDDRE